MRITDNLFYEIAEIIVEVSASDYCRWKKEYDRLHYQVKLSKEISAVSWDGFTTKAEVSPDIIPEESLLKKENYRKLKRALLSLEPDERKLIGMLYLSEKTAKHFGVSVSTIHKRREKILKKMKNFW